VITTLNDILRREAILEARESSPFSHDSELNEMLIEQQSSFESRSYETR